MRLFRLYHKPTGLFYCPSRGKSIGGRYVKTNLSKAGKVYMKNWDWKGIDSIYNHLQIDKNGRSTLQPFIVDEWEEMEIGQVK